MKSKSYLRTTPYYVFLGVLFMATAWFAQSAIDNEHLWVKIVAGILGLTLAGNIVYLVIANVKNEAMKRKVFIYVFLFFGAILFTVLKVAFEMQVFHYVSLAFTVVLIVIAYKDVVKFNKSQSQ